MLALGVPPLAVAGGRAATKSRTTLPEVRESPFAGLCAGVYACAAGA
jgi:hypothetical protein